MRAQDKQEEKNFGQPHIRIEGLGRDGRPKGKKKGGTGEWGRWRRVEISRKNSLIQKVRCQRRPTRERGKRKKGKINDPSVDHANLSEEDVELLVTGR